MTRKALGSTVDTNLNAEVVRGLVEEQHVGPREEGRRKGHSHAPAAAQGAEGPRQQLVAKACGGTER